MSRMIKRSLSFALAMVLLFSLTACATPEQQQQQQGTSTVPSSSAPAGPEYSLPMEEGYNQVTFYWKHASGIENCDMWIWWGGKDGSGNVVGYVAETEFSGAQGMITMVIGLDADKTCTGIYVTEHSETSGLGAKAAETSEGAWRDNLVGQSDGLALKKNGGSVEAISGATITSTAVVKEVQTVIDAVKALG